MGKYKCKKDMKSVFGNFCVSAKAGDVYTVNDTANGIITMKPAAPDGYWLTIDAADFDNLFEAVNEKKLFILVGDSGCGKTAVAERCMELMEGIERIRTCTSRPWRTGEPEDAYYFIDDEEFTRHPEKFVETTVYAGYHYGTYLAEVERAISGEHPVLWIMEKEGALKIKERFPDDTMVIHIDRDTKACIRAVMDRDIPEKDKLNRVIRMIKEDYHWADWAVSNNRTVTDAADKLADLIRLMNPSSIAR